MDTYTTRDRHRHMTECRNPECCDPPTTHHGGYCAPCYMYRRRHHNDADRPAHLIEAHYHRTINRLCTQNYTRVAPDAGSG